MNKQNSILIPFLAISVVLMLGYTGFGWENSLISTDVFRPQQNDLKGDAWAIFQNYNGWWDSVESLFYK